MAKRTGTSRKLRQRIRRLELSIAALKVKLTVALDNPLVQHYSKKSQP